MRKRLFSLESPRAAFIRVGLATIVFAALVIAFDAATRVASAQAVCAAYPQINKELSSNFAEAPVAIGLSRDGTVIQVFSADDGATWSIVKTDASGNSCLIASGEAWQNLPMKIRGPQV